MHECRSQGLLRVLQHVTNAEQSFVVWKHLEDGLAGRGDIDGMVLRERLAPTTSAIADSALGQWSDSAIVACEHAYGVRALFVVSDIFWPVIQQIDLYWRPTRFGCPWADPSAVAELAVKDKRQVRTLPVASAGVVSLVLHGTSLATNVEIPPREISLIRSAFTTPGEVVNAASVLLPRLPAKQFKRAAATMAGRDAFNSWRNFRVPSRALAVSFILSAARHPSIMRRRAAFRIRRRLDGECLGEQLIHVNRTVSSGETPSQFVRRLSASSHHYLVS